MGKVKWYGLWKNNKGTLISSRTNLISTKELYEKYPEGMYVTVADNRHKNISVNSPEYIVAFNNDTSHTYLEKEREKEPSVFYLDEEGDKKYISLENAIKCCEMILNKQSDGYSIDNWQNLFNEKTVMVSDVTTETKKYDKKENTDFMVVAGDEERSVFINKRKNCVSNLFGGKL